MKQFLAAFSMSLAFLTVQAEDLNTQLNTDNSVSTEVDEMLTLDEIPEVRTQVLNQKPQKAKKIYASALLGIAAYPEVTNVDKGYNVAVAAGYHFGEQFMVEIGLGMAKSQLSVKNQLYANQRDNFDINQYQANLAAKYRLDGLFDSNFKPVAGVVLSYTYRKYGQTNNPTVVSGNTGSSTAMDGGISGGVDYDLSQSFALGVDFRYMFNLSNQVSANYINPTYGYYGTPIESLQYYVAGLAARMNF